MRSLALLGCDYPDLGPLGVAGLPDGGALALSRGSEPKPYAHVDPNEDAALLVRSDAGVLLAVADGHNGAATSERVIQAVRARATDLLTAEPERFQAVLEEALVTLAGRLTDVGRSRSCLVVAALVGEHCSWGCLGDSTLFRAAESEPLARETDWVVGPDLRFDDALREAAFGTCERKPGERIALVTDGITNFVPPSGIIPGLLASDLDDPACARAIARAAMVGGAGDNVAVALFSGLV